ncbi:MAG TPA: DUF1552 domain-containing protein [Polyangiaceae bacterium]|nr:DUF1552 domain-containing protein [Polyangiaceae bacterium]
MKLSNFRLSRRSLLRGASGVAIALPWLEIMQPERQSRAAPVAAKRFLSVYTPGGTVLSKWTPSGTETSFTLSPILSPFESVKSKLLVLSGLDMKSAVGEQYQSGMVALLTGTKQASTLFAGGPSIDQVLAASASAGKSFPSLQFALRWGTGKARGKVSPFDILNFSNSSAFEPIAPRIDPVDIWNTLFRDRKPPTTDSSVWDKSILDALGGRYAALARRLGASDRQKLEQHLSKIREMERKLAEISQGRCSVPALIDTSDYDPLAGLNSSDTGSIVDAQTDAAIPKVGKLMMDMMVTALACDLTAVGTLQWSDGESKYTLPWLNLPQTHRFYMNDGGYHPLECEKIATWYSQQSAYLLQQMAAVDMGGHSLLDESVVFFGSEGQDPATHAKSDMPFLLAGGGGGLRGGRFLRYPNVSHNGLLASILNLFGDTRTTFGDPAYAVPPLDNLV